MSSIDDVIRKRLDKLKEYNPGSASNASTSGNIPKTVKKTAAEQVEDLIAQLSEETSLDSKAESRAADIDSQIRSRLVRLKSREGCDFLSLKDPPRSKDVAAEAIEDKEFFETCSCSKLLADLEGCQDVDTHSEGSDASETLCVICDEKKPSLVCLGCEKDCYCSKCFKEFHSDDDEHKTVPFLKKL